MFHTLRPISFKAFYNTMPHIINNYNNGGGGDDRKFFLFLLGITIYSVNKLLK